MAVSGRLQCSTSRAERARAGLFGEETLDLARQTCVIGAATVAHVRSGSKRSGRHAKLPRLKGTNQIGMTTAVSSFSDLRGGAVYPFRTIGLWRRMGWLLLCLALALVLSLVIAPGEAQAHGVHGTSVSITQSPENATPPQADSPDAAERSWSDCVTCCSSSSCLVTTLVTHDLPFADEPRDTYQSASIIVVYQASPHGLLRPPRHSS